MAAMGRHDERAALEAAVRAASRSRTPRSARRPHLLRRQRAGADVPAPGCAANRSTLLAEPRLVPDLVLDVGLAGRRLGDEHRCRSALNPSISSSWIGATSCSAESLLARRRLSVCEARQADQPPSHVQHSQRAVRSPASPGGRGRHARLPALRVLERGRWPSSDLCRPDVRGSAAWIGSSRGCRTRTAVPGPRTSTPGRQVLVECFLHDKQVLIRLSQWDRADAGHRPLHRARRTSVSPQCSADGTLYALEARTSPQPDHPYLGVFLWLGHAFSAAVYASSDAELVSILRSPHPSEAGAGRPVFRIPSGLTRG